MKEKELTTIGLEMPEDFDSDSYEIIHERVRKYAGSETGAKHEYLAAWNGLAYRYLSCAKFDSEFTESVALAGDAPPQPERFVQEHALFGFFVSGLAAIESLCYGLFAMASMVDPHSFPMSTPIDLRRIRPELVSSKFGSIFSGYAITNSLDTNITSTEYRNWKEIRNILAHRTAPGRMIYFATRNTTRPSVWKVDDRTQIDYQTTSSRRGWLSKIVRVLLTDTTDFANTLF